MVAQPGVQMFGDKGVVVEMRIRRVDTVDLLLLSRRQVFVWIEAVAAREDETRPNRM